MKKILIFIIPTILLTISCNNKENKQFFNSWNSCSSLTALKAYVEDVTNEKSLRYSVAPLKSW